MRDYKPGQPKMGTILVQGTMSTDNSSRSCRSWTGWA